MWYDTGTVAVANGSTIVTGTGTNFISGAQIGEAFLAPDDKLYEIQSITSATTLVLADSYLGSTQSGQDYKIIPTQSLVADLASQVTDLITDYSNVKDTAGAGKFNDGTVTAPAITFEQDQNNGLYRIGSDNWGMSAGGQKQVDISTTDVELNYSGSKKLATTSTGVDVTGTVTSDGLTVDGVSSLGNTSVGQLNIAGLTKITGVRGTFVDPSEDPSVPNIFSTSDAVGDFSQEAGHLVIQPRVHPTVYRDVIFAGGAGTTKRLMTIQGEGDVSFYEDTGTTAKFHWDSSAESLGIGTASPSNNLAIYESSTGNAGIDIDNTQSGTALTIGKQGSTAYGATSAGDGAIYVYDASLSLMADGGAGNASVIKFATGGSAERARIDSSGNLLVGTTNSLPYASSTETGVSILANGTITNSTSATSAIFNTLNDGTITQFRKDGSTVGSIGTGGGDLLIGSTTTGIIFTDSVEAIIPHSPSSGLVTDTTSLGWTNQRFKDLYLSGGVYLGGTGAANKLDDYEEGSWTPSYIGTTTNPTVTYDSIRDGRYTKIGNLVVATFIIKTDSVSGGSGNLNIGGLPFSVVSTSSYNAGTVSIAEINGFASTPPLSGRPSQGGTVISLQYRSSLTDISESQVPISALATGANSNTLAATITYYTTDS